MAMQSLLLSAAAAKLSVCVLSWRLSMCGHAVTPAFSYGSQVACVCSIHAAYKQLQ